MKILTDSLELVPVESVRPHPQNVNVGDVGAIYESITESGFFGAIVVQRSTGHILAGSHRWKAARDAGATEIPATFVDVDDERALRIMLADNRTARLGHDDPAALAGLLQEIHAETGTLTGTGFSADDLDEILADLARPLAPTDPANDPNAEWEGMPGYEHEDKTAFRSLVVHFKDNASVLAFAEVVGQKVTDKTRFLWYPEQEIIRYGEAE